MKGPYGSIENNGWVSSGFSIRWVYIMLHVKENVHAAGKKKCSTFNLGLGSGSEDKETDPHVLNYSQVFSKKLTHSWKNTHMSSTSFKSWGTYRSINMCYQLSFAWNGCEAPQRNRQLECWFWTVHQSISRCQNFNK